MSKKFENLSEMGLADFHRNPPQLEQLALHGLVGDIARAGAANSEANPAAIALNILAYLGVTVGRGVYLRIGDTIHHSLIFGLHVGRSSVARKGDSTALVFRLADQVCKRNECLAPQIHRGGLSTREGLIRLVHDAYQDGKDEVSGINDKRLLVAESEFANVLHQGKREGNTLSAALRDCWDGQDLKPATRHNLMGASNPHIGIMAAITPFELTTMIASRDLTNGFFNRFLVIYAERQRLVSMPTGTPAEVVVELVDRLEEVLQFCKADRWFERDHTEMKLSEDAKQCYDRLYYGELNDVSMGERIAALIQRRAPMLLRMAMLFALCDLQTTIEVHHLEAAMGWIRFSTESVKYIFASGEDEVKVAETQANAAKVMGFLQTKGPSSRTRLSNQCFHKHKDKLELDGALDELLGCNPPRIVVETVTGKNGRSSKVYRLASANAAKSEKLLAVQQELAPQVEGEDCGISEFSADDEEFLRSVRLTSQWAENVDSVDSSSLSHPPLNPHELDNEIEG